MQKQEVHYHFHVEQIQVEHVNLEQLLFQLEKIHTEHLNGTLNLGNNFGTASSTATTNLQKINQQGQVGKPSRQVASSQAVHVNIRGRG